MKIKALIAVAVTGLISAAQIYALPEGELLAENSTTSQTMGMPDSSSSVTTGEQQNIGATTTNTSVSAEMSNDTAVSATTDTSVDASPDTATGDDDY